MENAIMEKLECNILEDFQTFAVVHTFQIRQFGIDGLESNFVELLLDFHQLEHRGGVTIFPRDKR